MQGTVLPLIRRLKQLLLRNCGVGTEAREKNSHPILNAPAARDSHISRPALLLRCSIRPARRLGMSKIR